VPPDRNTRSGRRATHSHVRKGIHQMFELTGAEVLGLQSVAESAQLRRRGGGGHGGGSSYRKNICLITLNGTLNGLSILNILNGFGGF